MRLSLTQSQNWMTSRKVNELTSNFILEVKHVKQSAIRFEFGSWWFPFDHAAKNLPNIWLPREAFQYLACHVYLCSFTIKKLFIQRLFNLASPETLFVGIAHSQTLQSPQLVLAFYRIPVPSLHMCLCVKNGGQIIVWEGWLSRLLIRQIV